MNAAIDQQCELYIKENGLEAEVEEKIKKIYEQLGSPRPQYNAELPQGHNGLGLMLLGSGHLYIVLLMWSQTL